MTRRNPKIVSYNMSRIRGKDTKPELALRRALHRLGLRYRLHADLPGRPDILFPKAKVAVFVDGAFWHGRDLSATERELRVRRSFWMKKIRDNVARDRRNNAKLGALGYCVLRIWDDEVLEAPEETARRIRAVVRKNAAKDAEG